jgi:hypothetical protein
MNSLDRDQRLAGLGALGILVSLFMPWYGIAVLICQRRQVPAVARTGWGSFSLIELALVLTAGAAIALLVARMQSRRIKVPLRDGTLLGLAGVWSALLVVERWFDRPGDVCGTGFSLKYGIFVAFAGAIALAIGGIRHRRAERGPADVPAPPLAPTEAVPTEALPTELLPPEPPTAAGSGETPGGR